MFVNPSNGTVNYERLLAYLSATYRRMLPTQHSSGTYRTDENPPEQFDEGVAEDGRMTPGTRAQGNQPVWSGTGQGGAPINQQYYGGQTPRQAGGPPRIPGLFYLILYNITSLYLFRIRIEKYCRSEISKCWN